MISRALVLGDVARFTGMNKVRSAGTLARDAAGFRVRKLDCPEYFRDNRLQIRSPLLKLVWPLMSTHLFGLFYLIYFLGKFLPKEIKKKVDCTIHRDGEKIRKKECNFYQTANP